MAGKTTTRGRSTAAAAPAVGSGGLSPGTRERLREVVSLLLLGMTLFIALACASAGRGDNLCGPTGERVALLLLGSFGYASWLLVVCFATWGLVLFTRVQSVSLSIRASGMGFCLVALSALLTHLLGDTGLRFAPGGVVGEYIHEQLMVTGGLGEVGTRIVLIMLTLVTFVLATDIAYYAAVAGGLRWLGARGSAMKEARAAARVEAEADELRRTREEAKRLANQAKVIREEAKLVRAQAAADRAAAKVAKEANKAAALEGDGEWDEDEGGGVAVDELQPGDLEDVDLDADPDNEDEVALAEDTFDGLIDDDDEDDEDDGHASLAATAVEDDEELADEDEYETDDEELADEDELEADDEDEELIDEDEDEDELEADDDEDEDEDEDDELADDDELEDEEAADDEDELEVDDEYETDEDDIVEDEVEGEEDEDEDDEQETLFEDDDVEADDEYEYEEDDDEAAAGDDLSSDKGLAEAARTRPRVREMIDSSTQKPLPFQPTASAYVFPSESLLDDQEAVDQAELDELLADKTETLERTLLSFKIEARVVEIQKGPVISMFEMALAPGIKLGRVKALEDDLAIALRARSVRIVAPLPGKNTIGIEVPNPLREMVRLKPLLHCREFDDKKQALPLFLGRDSAGRPQVADLARMPHLLVAGATGAGKSVCLNTIICSLLFTRTPEQVKLILIDPKMVEMTLFSDVPHLACPVVTDMKRAPGILEWAVSKMEERYQLLSRAGVRNIAGYNKLSEERLRARFGDVIESEDFPRKLPFIVIVVDELADLMMTAAKDVETSISRLAAKSRAVGIHIILATQRPSTNVITGLIKANLPTRIAFMVSSKIDSRVILDANGAEQLLGQGDMLMLSPANVGLMRGQCTFMSDEEVTLVTESIASASGPIYEKELVQRRREGAPDPSEVDELYDPATRFIIDTRRGSASLLQRKFAIGYTRASRLIDLMAEEGVLGEFKGSQAREVEMTLEEWVAINPEARESGHEEQGGGDAWETAADEVEEQEQD